MSAPMDLFLLLLIIGFTDAKTAGGTIADGPGKLATTLTIGRHNSTSQPTDECFRSWRPIIRGLKMSGVELIMRAHNLSHHLTSEYKINEDSLFGNGALRPKSTFNTRAQVNFDSLDEKIKLLGDSLLAGKQESDKLNLLKHELSSIVSNINESISATLAASSSPKLSEELANLAATLVVQVEMFVGTSVGQESAEESGMLLAEANSITEQVQHDADQHLSSSPVALEDLMEIKRSLELTHETIMGAEAKLEVFNAKLETIKQTIGSFSSTDNHKQVAEDPLQSIDARSVALSKSLKVLESSWTKAREDMQQLSRVTLGSETSKILNECKKILNDNYKLSRFVTQNQTDDQQTITVSHLSAAFDLRRQVEHLEDHLSAMQNGNVGAKIKIDEETESLVRGTKAINADCGKSIKALRKQAVEFEDSLMMRSNPGSVPVELNLLVPNVVDLAHLHSRMAQMQMASRLKQMHDFRLIDGQMIKMRALELTNNRLLQNMKDMKKKLMDDLAATGNLKAG